MSQDLMSSFGAVGKGAGLLGKVLGCLESCLAVFYKSSFALFRREGRYFDEADGYI